MSNFRTLVALTSLVAAAAGANANLLTNGNFEAGNTGFSSDYQYSAANVSPYIGQYGVTSSSFAWTNFWGTVPGDHTTGTGLFLIADGGPNLSAAIWRQTVAVPINTQLSLTGWLATWTSFPANVLRVEVDGVPVTTWAAPGNGAWTQYSASWTSGASGTATIALVPNVYFQPGADVAIDDLVLVPAPGAGAALGVAALASLRRKRR